MARRRTGTTALFGLLGLISALAAPAFACSDNASITSNPAVGLAGSRVTVTGKQFLPPSQGSAVEIRWNTSTGTLLGSAAGMSFSVEVQIPANVKPSYNYIVAVQRNADNSKAWERATPFEVESAAPAPTVPATVPANSPDPATATGANPAADPATSAVTSPSPTSAAASTSAPASAAPPLAAAPTAGSPGTAPTRQTAPAAASSAPGAGKAGAPAVAVTPIRATPSVAAESPGAAATPEASAPGQPVLPDKGWSTAPAGNAVPSLFNADPSLGQHSTSAALGIGLVVTGLLALLTAAAVAGRRRLALAHRSNRH